MARDVTPCLHIITFRGVPVRRQFSKKAVSILAVCNLAVSILAVGYLAVGNLAVFYIQLGNYRI